LGGFEQQLDLGIQRPGEVPTQGLAAAGGDGRYLAMAGEKGLELGERGRRLVEGIETELNEARVFTSRFSPGEELRGGGSVDSNTQFAYPQARQCRSLRGQRFGRAGDRKRHLLQLTHLKDLLRPLQHGIWTGDGLGTSVSTPVTAPERLRIDEDRGFVTDIAVGCAMCRVPGAPRSGNPRRRLTGFSGRLKMADAPPID